MALEYSLIVATDTPPEAFIARMFPDEHARPRFEATGRIWVGDLRKRMGFEIRAVSGKQGYFEAQADGPEPWVWQPERYANLGFRMDKFFPPVVARRHLLELVANVVRSCDDDLALVFNGDVLLLSRFAGSLTRSATHGFWDNFSPGDIPAALASSG